MQGKPHGNEPALLALEFIKRWLVPFAQRSDLEDAEKEIKAMLKFVLALIDEEPFKPLAAMFLRVKEPLQDVLLPKIQNMMLEQSAAKSLEELNSELEVLLLTGCRFAFFAFRRLRVADVNITFAALRSPDPETDLPHALSKRTGMLLQALALSPEFRSVRFSLA